jgi:hypothetical protein
MKRTLLTIASLCLIGCGSVFAALWTPYAGRMPENINTVNFQQYRTYKVDETELKSVLTRLPKAKEVLLDLPKPDGTFRKFRIAEATLIPEPLQKRYPSIKAFIGVATDDPNVTASLDITVYGFHAMVFDGENTALIDPVNNSETSLYTVHYKRHETRLLLPGHCQTRNENPIDAEEMQLKSTASANAVVNGNMLRTYRLALACSHQYAEAVTGKIAPSKEEVLSKMTTTMNRVNGIYQREIAVVLQFVDNVDTLIFTTATGDPYAAADDARNAYALVDINQQTCDTLIGDANYDVGHVFSKGGGGLAQVGATCRQGLKAQAVTGSETPYGDAYDVDYVAHEIGHEFGADHTFNNSKSQFCAGQAVAARAVEPGSGSTIMAYAGICSPDNLQTNSDFYFHGISVKQLVKYITTTGDGCAAKTPTGRKAPGIASFSANYTIPARTPFELTAPVATDSNGVADVHYCWEQWDLGGFGLTLSETSTGGPLFRSYTPVASPVRVFPNLKMVRVGLLSNAGINNASGEKIPEVTRSLKFRVALRTQGSTTGSYHMPDDSVMLSVINTGEGFKVTSQNTPGITYDGYSAQVVNWNVAGSDAAPINAKTVDIFISYDDGETWIKNLGTFPNTGVAVVSIPNPDTLVSSARIKVKGSGNVFFSMNTSKFAITHNYQAGISVHPVPTRDVLYVEAKNAGNLDATVINMIGQRIWHGVIADKAELPVWAWGRGHYFLIMVDDAGRNIQRRFVVE